MSVDKRRFCIVAPGNLFVQIERRGSIHQRSRNQEIAYLLEFALSELDGSDPVVASPVEGGSRTNLYLPTTLVETIRLQADQNHRAVGTQMIRLLKFALDRMTRRDLDLIEEMVRAGRSKDEPQQTDMAELQPSS